MKGVHLLTPTNNHKEGFRTFNRFELSESQEHDKHRTPSSSKKSSINEKMMFKSPFSQQNQCIQVIPEVYGMMQFTAISTPRSESSRASVSKSYRSPNGGMTPQAMLQRQAIQQHLIDSNSDISYSSLKSAEKANLMHLRPSIIMQHSSEKVYKYATGLFSNRDSPAAAGATHEPQQLVHNNKMTRKQGNHHRHHRHQQHQLHHQHQLQHQYLQHDQQEHMHPNNLNNGMLNGPPNTFMQLACNAVTAALHEEHPSAHGNLVLKRPKFIIQLEDSADTEELRIDSEIQRRIHDKLSKLELMYVSQFDPIAAAAIASTQARCALKEESPQNAYDKQWRQQQRNPSQISLEDQSEEEEDDDDEEEEDEDDDDDEDEDDEDDEDYEEEDQEEQSQQQFQLQQQQQLLLQQQQQQQRMVYSPFLQRGQYNGGEFMGQQPQFGMPTFDQRQVISGVNFTIADAPNQQDSGNHSFRAIPSQSQRQTQNLFEQNQLRKKVKKEQEQPIKKQEQKKTGVQEERKSQRIRLVKKEYDYYYGEDLSGKKSMMETEEKDSPTAMRNYGSFSTIKKNKGGNNQSSSSKKPNNSSAHRSTGESTTLESLNKKRRILELDSTPVVKRTDFSTPSTKKKFDRGISLKFSAAPTTTITTTTSTVSFECSEQQQQKHLTYHLQEEDGSQQQLHMQQYQSQSQQQSAKPQSSESGSKKECCGCKKTKCLKLYCECFQAMKHCTNCNCNGCMNKPDFESVRKQAMDVIQLRNSTAFEPKVDKFDEAQENAPTGPKIHSKGCNCKRSDCRKKYCECFQMGAKCTHLCKCLNCKNTGDHDPTPHQQAGASACSVTAIAVAATNHGASSISCSSNNNTTIITIPTAVSVAPTATTFAIATECGKSAQQIPTTQIYVQQSSSKIKVEEEVEEEEEEEEYNPLSLQNNNNNTFKSKQQVTTNSTGRVVSVGESNLVAAVKTDWIQPKSQQLQQPSQSYYAEFNQQHQQQQQQQQQQPSQTVTTTTTTTTGRRQLRKIKCIESSPDSSDAESKSAAMLARQQQQKQQLQQLELMQQQQLLQQQQQLQRSHDITHRIR